MTNKVQQNTQQVQQIIESYMQQVDIFELMLDGFSDNSKTLEGVSVLRSAPGKRIPFSKGLYFLIHNSLIDTHLYDVITHSKLFRAVAKTGIFVKLGR